MIGSSSQVGMTKRREKKILIISEKLAPPCSLLIVTRERLLSYLDASTQAKLIAVVAGAGFGKSTLVAEYLRSRGHPFVWYQLEETDRDLSVFLFYLMEAMRRLSGSAPAPHGPEGNVPRNLAEATPELLVALSEIGAHRERDYFLVLDNFHAVCEVRYVAEVLDFLLPHLPANFHLVVLSCRELNLDLARLRARRELLELGEEELSFRPDETARLFAEVFSLPLEDEEAAVLTELTEGWVSGLVLLFHTLNSRGKAGLNDLVRETELPSAYISEYFHRIVYQDLEPEVKDFLLKTSLLSRLQPNLCDALLGKEISRRLLSRLVQDHLFTIPLDLKRESYRYHRLFRAFLRERLSEALPSRQLAELHLRAAFLWEGCGELEEAVRHYVKAGEYKRAAELLEAMADGSISSSRISFLYRILKVMPSKCLRRHPRLLYYRSLLLDLLGRWDQALDLYLETASHSAQRGDAETQMKCLAQALKIDILSGKPAEAGELMNELLSMVKKLSTDSSSWYELSALLGAGSIYLGLTHLTQILMERALAFAERTENREVRAMLLSWCGFSHLILGNYHFAMKLLQRARHVAEQEDLASYLPDIYCNLSFTHIALGNAEEAREMAEKGIEVSYIIIGEEPAYPGVMKNLQARALAWAILGEREKAWQDMQKACRISGEIADRWEAINSHIFAGMIALDAGDVPGALDYFRTAEGLCREKKFRDNEMLCRLSRLALTAEDGSQEVVRCEAAEAFEVVVSRGAGVLYVAAHILKGCIEYKLGDIDSACQSLSAAISIDEASGAIGWWKAYARLALPLIAEVFGRGEHLEFLSRILRFIGTDALPYLHLLMRSSNLRIRKKAREIAEELEKETALPLRIKMLGSFEVSVGEESIPQERWKSKRALAIFKYLAAHHSRGNVNREVLMELFWPDISPASASKNLNMALTSLRKTLEPEARWGESHYLVSSGKLLRLYLGRGGWVDVDLFQSKLHEALKAEVVGETARYLRLLLEAESLYLGDFLAEDIYEDWCIPIRENLRRQYLDVLQRLAREYDRCGELAKAILYLEKATQYEPDNEGICRLLMELYASIGDRAGVEKTFLRCKSFLSENYGIKISQETEERYRQLQGK